MVKNTSKERTVISLKNYVVLSEDTVKGFLMDHMIDFQMLSKQEKLQKHRNSLFTYIKNQTNIDIQYGLTSAEGLLLIKFNSPEEKTLFLLKLNGN